MKACLSYPGSMMPLPSLSKISKACLMSMTYSRGRVTETKSSGLNGFLSGTALPPLAGTGVGFAGGGLVFVGPPFFIRYFTKL